MAESSSEQTGGTDTMRKSKSNDVSLLLSALKSIRKARGRGCKGSEGSIILEEKMSTRILHLACRHDAVECARLLLDGGQGITASLVDAKDELMRTPLHIAAESHSASCIKLLLSRNACTDLTLLDGRPLTALEVALMSKKLQVDWSPDKSVEDLLADLQQKDLMSVGILAQTSLEVGELAYRCAMEGRVTELAMLLLVAEDKILGTIRTKRSIYNSVVDEVLSTRVDYAKDGRERRKALLCEIQLLNEFGASSWRDKNIDRRTLPPLLRAAKAGDMSVTKMLLMGDVDVNETDLEGNTALHWTSTHEPRIVYLLLKNGASIFQENKLGLTPLHSAAAKGNYKALQLLLPHAQDCVDIPSHLQETPLFLAAKNGSLSCVQLLLHSGANPNAPNITKQRPIDVATSQDMRFVLNYANVAPLNNGSLEEGRVMKRNRSKELLDEDSNNIHTSYAMPNSHSTPKFGAAQPAICSKLTTLYVKSDKGQYPIRISLNDQTICLKNVVAEKIGYPVQASIFRFDGNRLEDKMKLSSYGLQESSTVEVTLKLLGGQPPDNRKRKFDDLSKKNIIPDTSSSKSAEEVSADEASKQILIPDTSSSKSAEEVSAEEAPKKSKKLLNRPIKSADEYAYDVTLDVFANLPNPSLVLPSLVETAPISGIHPGGLVEDSHELTPTGRRFGRRIVSIFRKAKNDHKTWGGEIGLADFRAHDGQLYLIKDPKKYLGADWKDEWKKDCVAEADILEAIFMKDGKVTPYMKDLVDELKAADPRCAWSDWFSNFQVTSLAFKPSHRRLHAPQDIWRYYETAQTEEARTKFTDVMETVSVPTIWEEKGLGNVPVFLDTFARHMRKHDKEYSTDAMGCLAFTRNYGTHAKVLDYLRTEVPIPMLLGNFLSQLIKKFLERGYNFDKVLDDE